MKKLIVASLIALTTLAVPANAGDNSLDRAVVLSAAGEVLIGLNPCKGYVPSYASVVAADVVQNAINRGEYAAERRAEISRRVARDYVDDRVGMCLFAIKFGALVAE